jgi:hypothetical protein
MKKTIGFLVLLALLALPLVALGQTSVPTPVATVTFSADPIGYLQAHWAQIALALFLVAKAIVRYAPKPAEGSLWAWIFAALEQVSLPTPQVSTPAGKLAAGAVAVPLAEPPPPVPPPSS